VIIFSTSGRQRVEGSFENLLERARIRDFRFHDLRHTFASWYMIHGGDLYELAKILGHSNIQMTERYAKLGRQHIARTGNTAREIWKLLEKEEGVQAHTG
jgi:integrase